MVKNFLQPGLFFFCRDHFRQYESRGIELGLAETGIYKNEHSVYAVVIYFVHPGAGDVSYFSVAGNTVDLVGDTVQLAVNLCF